MDTLENVIDTMARLISDLTGMDEMTASTVFVIVTMLAVAAFMALVVMPLMFKAAHRLEPGPSPEESAELFTLGRRVAELQNDREGR